MGRTAPAYDEFIQKYSSFVNTDSAIVLNQLDFSSRILDSSAWGDFYSDAVELDTAHNITLFLIANSGTNGGQQTAAGPISSVSAAGVSTSFDSASALTKTHTDSWYSKTGYGQQFLMLRNRVFSPAIMAV